MVNIVQSPDVQSDIFGSLIDSMAAANLTVPPQLPLGDTIAQNKEKDAQNAQQAGQQSGDDKQKGFLPSTQNSVVTKTANDAVTRAIANTGQLIPVGPKTTTGSDSNDMAQIKQLIGQLSSQQSTQAQPQQQQKSSDGGFLGDIVDVATAFLSWIICTELVRQGRLDKRWYYAGAKVFSAYPRFVKEGYYLWAIPSVRHLRAHPDSYYSKFLELIFNWRAENIAAHCGVKGARYLRRGAFVTVVLWPVCYILGCVVAALRCSCDPLQVYKETK